MDGTGMGGHYITLEGGEGSGKSTVINTIAERLAANSGREVILLREPHGAYRKLLFDAERPECARTDAMLFAAGRAELVETTIRPGLEAGAIILSDRSVWTSMAYQGLELGTERIAAVNDIALDGVWPELVIWLDVDPAQGLARQIGESDRFGDQQLEEAWERREQYSEFYKQHQDTWVRIDGGADIETVAENVYHAIMRIIAGEGSGIETQGDDA